MKHDYCQDTLIILACDLSNDTGEGRLACSLLDAFSSKQLNFTVYKDFITKTLSKNAHARDRFLPIYLVIIAIILSVKRKKVVYLNYCPIWNPSIFLLTNIGVLLGPITGSHGLVPEKKQTISSLLRKRLLPLLSYLSVKVCDNLQTYWTATPTVSSYLNKHRIRNDCGRPFLMDHSFRSDTLSLLSVKYDIFIYATKHPMKNYNELMEMVSKKIDNNLKICWVGQCKLQQTNIENHSKVSSQKFFELLSQSSTYLTLSYEDAGIAAFQAINLRKPLLFPIESPLSLNFKSALDFNIQDKIYLSRSNLEAILSKDELHHVNYNYSVLKKEVKKAHFALDNWCNGYRISQIG
jgi:hypothetical protein